MAEVGLLNRLAGPHGCLAGVFQVGLRKYDCKLLAAITGHEVHFSHLPAEQPGHAPQHLVAGLMTVHIVDFFESVHVGHQQREGPAVTAELGDAAVQFVIKLAAVRQQRERIGAGLDRVDLNLLGLFAELVLRRGKSLMDLLVGLDQLRHHSDDQRRLGTVGRR